MGTTNRSEGYKEIEAAFGEVPTWMKQIPDETFGGFWTLMRDFGLADTKIPSKYKHLIGLGVSGATRCRYCTLFHTEAARLQGATDEEIAEASTMAGLTMMISTFINAQHVDYEQFRKETIAMVAYVKKQQASKGGAKAPKTGHAPSH